MKTALRLPSKEVIFEGIVSLLFVALRHDVARTRTPVLLYAFW